MSKLMVDNRKNVFIGKLCRLNSSKSWYNHLQPFRRYLVLNIGVEDLTCVTINVKKRKECRLFLFYWDVGSQNDFLHFLHRNLKNYYFLFLQF